MEGCKSLMNRCICSMHDNVFVDLGDIDAHPVGISESVEETFNVVNYVMKSVCGGEGAGENEGEGEYRERTETDDVGDGPTVDATQATQEGVVESKEVDEKKAVEEVAKEVDEEKAVEE